MNNQQRLEFWKQATEYAKTHPWAKPPIRWGLYCIVQGGEGELEPSIYHRIVELHASL